MNLKHVTAVAVCLAVVGCSKLSGPEGQDNGVSNQYSIYLTGRILDKDGSPMANAVVKLKSRCLCDTTNANGYYCISEKRGDHQLPDPCKDSLEYCKDGQTITQKNIPNWIDTLRDVYMIQRDIWGGLTIAPQSFGRITATITGADSTPEVAELWYNVANQCYSGFVYFAYSADSMNYSVYVSVYNSAGVLTGRSVIVTFPSKTAGDINMPAFDPNNACAGNDSTVDTVNRDTVTHDTVTHDTVPQTSGLPVLVDDSTPGYVNQNLGNTLDGTSYLFGDADPTIDSAPEPDLSPVASVLGNWLSNNPVGGNPNWSAIQQVPKQWAVSTEIAVIYPVWISDSGTTAIIGNFGVDNGVFVWVNGVYKFGAEAPMYAYQWEYPNVNLGDLHQGLNYIEILLEDQEVENSFTLLITKSK